jgi:hypothetical protein
MAAGRRRIELSFGVLGALAAILLPAAVSYAQSRDHFEVGLCRSNTIWQPKAKQAAIITGIQATGLHWFRDAFAYPPQRMQDFVEVVRMAKLAGLKMLVVITQNETDYDGAAATAENAGPAFKKRCGWESGSLKLSRINTGKFKSRLRGLLSALKAARLKVDAFEIGNEVDWVCFNGDVPFGRKATPHDVLVAARGYARFLQAAAETIRDPRFFPDAKIITFGIAHADAGWDETPPHHLPNPAAFVASLRHLDGVNYLSNARYRIDGYGLHIYPDPNHVKASVAATLKKDSAALGSDLPYWITEFGWRKSQFPNSKGESRARAVAQFFAALAADRRNRFGPAFYYDYDGPSWGIVDQRGRLLPAARALAHAAGVRPKE